MVGEMKRIAWVAAVAAFALATSGCGAGHTRATSGVCPGAYGLGGIAPRPNAFTRAAGADGGCVNASFLGGVPIPAGAQQVDVGRYQGYLVPGTQAELYVYTPPLGG